MKDGLAALAVRLTGVVIALFAIRSGAMYVAAWSSSATNSDLFLFLGPLVAMFMAALIMITFPRSIAHKFIPVVPEDEKSQTLSTGDLALLACLLMGLYLLVQSILNLTYVTSAWIVLQQMDNPHNILPPQYISMAATAAVEFILAIWLLSGSKSLVGMIRWLRQAALDAQIK